MNYHGFSIIGYVFHILFCPPVVEEVGHMSKILLCNQHCSAQWFSSPFYSEYLYDMYDRGMNNSSQNIKRCEN